MAGIVQQIDEVWIGDLHQLVDLFGCLDAGAHMVMDRKVHTLFFGEAAHFVEALADQFPLLVGIDRLFAEDGNGFALNGVALLGSADDFCAERVQKIAVFDKRFDRGVVAFAQKQRGEPRVADTHAAHVELVFERCNVFRVFVADLAAGEACQRHFADALFKRVFRAEIGQIVVGPRDRSDRKLYFVFIQHWYSPFGCSIFFTDTLNGRKFGIRNSEFGIAGRHAARDAPNNFRPPHTKIRNSIFFRVFLFLYLMFW